MDDLVKATVVSRHGIYAEFGGKKGLFLACFDRYQELVVTPAFSSVERPGATLADVAAYFETQIALAEDMGLPGPGCFVANAATEMAPHDADVRARVDAHNCRLREGFRNALFTTRTLKTSTDNDVAEMADALLMFATGLWSMSRVAADAGVLRSSVTAILTSFQRRLT